MFTDFDSTRSYKTQQALEAHIEKAGLSDLRYLVVKVPYGKNVDRFTAIFHWNSGNGQPAAFEGYKVMA